MSETSRYADYCTAKADGVSYKLYCELKANHGGPVHHDLMRGETWTVDPDE